MPASSAHSVPVGGKYPLTPKGNQVDPVRHAVITALMWTGIHIFGCSRRFGHSVIEPDYAPANQDKTGRPIQIIV